MQCSTENVVLNLSSTSSCLDLQSPCRSFVMDIELIRAQTICAPVVQDGTSPLQLNPPALSGYTREGAPYKRDGRTDGCMLYIKGNPSYRRRFFWLDSTLAVKISFYIVDVPVRGQGEEILRPLLL